MKINFILLLLFFLGAFSVNASCLDKLLKVTTPYETLNERLNLLWGQFAATEFPMTVGMEFEYSSRIGHEELAERVTRWLDELNAIMV